MTTVPFGTQLIGRTEKALNALLDRQLAGTGLTEPQWVALTLTVTADRAPSADAAAGRVAEALKTGRDAARGHLADLAAAGLVQVTPVGTVEATAAGRAQWDRVRAAVARITGELWGDLPEAERAVAGKVLNTVLSRANALLDAA